MLKREIERIAKEYAEGNYPKADALNAVADLLAKWPDHVDGPLAMTLSTLLQDISADMA